MRRLVLLAMVFYSSLGVAQTPDLSQSSALERKLFVDARDGRLDRYTMMDAAFIASGLPDQEALELYRKKYRKLLGKARKEAGRHKSRLTKARAVFDLLHTTALKRYGLHSVDMVGVFSRGDYNCVSATVLYNAVLDDIGIESWGILVPSHAYSVVQVDGRQVEVETTSPKGFDPARTDEAYRELLRQYNLDGAAFSTGGQGGAVSLIREIQGDKKPVDNLTMIAVIYSNLAAARVKDGDMQGALANFVKAAELSNEGLHFQASRDALLNNLVVDLIQGKSFLQAARAAAAARAIPGLSESFVKKLANLQGHAVTQEAMARIAAQKFESAIGLYDQALAELPANELLLHNRQVGYINWGIQLNKQGQYRQAATVVLKALSLYPDAAIVQNNYLATVQKYIRSRRQANDLDHALRIANHALGQASSLYDSGHDPRELLLRLQMEVGLVYFAKRDYGASIEYFVPGLSTGKDLYVTNYLAASGNLAKAFLNEGKTEEAYTAVSAALSQVGAPVAGRHLFYKAYWPAAIGYAKTLQKSGSAARGLQIATSLPATTIDPTATPALYRAYWQTRAELLAATGARADCRGLLRGVSDTGMPDWLERVRSHCAGAR